jgi:hypothetical protein
VLLALHALARLLAALAGGAFALASAPSQASEPAWNDPFSPRSWQVSAGVGIFFPTQVWANLITDSKPSVSYHADVTVPLPFVDVGFYMREVMLRSADTHGTASLFTGGIEAKYELRLGRGVYLRAGVLFGIHDFETNTVSHATALDFAWVGEYAVQVVPHWRLRLAVQGTGDFAAISAAPYWWFRNTVVTSLGVEGAFRVW